MTSKLYVEVIADTPVQILFVAHPEQETDAA
jgi:hypothetical protein